MAVALVIALARVEARATASTVKQYYFYSF